MSIVHGNPLTSSISLPGTTQCPLCFIFHLASQTHCCTYAGGVPPLDHEPKPVREAFSCFHAGAGVSLSPEDAKQSYYNPASRDCERCGQC